MWLRTLHVFGLTNLTDEQVAAFEAIVSLHRAKSSEGDMLNLWTQHERSAPPLSSIFLSVSKLLSAKGHGVIASASLGALFFVSLIVSIDKIGLMADENLVGSAVNAILLFGLFICVLSIVLNILGHAVTSLFRKDRNLNNSEPDSDDTDGSPR